MAATMRIFPASLARSVAQAIAGTAVGGKRAAGYGVLSSAFGATLRVWLVRAGQVVADMGRGTPLSASGGTVVLLSYDSIAPLVAADIATPAYAGAIDPNGWLLRVGRADGAAYVEGPVGPLGSTAPFKLTSSVAVGKGMAITLSFGFDAALDGVSAGWPSSNDPRTVAWLDPTLPWASQPAAVDASSFGGQLWPQVNPDWWVGSGKTPPAGGTLTSQIPEAGIADGGVIVLDRVPDPLNGARSAFLHRLSPLARLFTPAPDGTARSAYLTPDRMPYDTEQWLAFGVRWMGWPGRTTTCFDVHDTSTSDPAYAPRLSPHRQSPIQMWLDPDGRYTWSVHGCYLPGYTVTPVDQVTHTYPFTSQPISSGAGVPGEYHFFVLNYRIARSIAAAPFLKVWRAVGSGALSQIVDVSAGSVPIGYYDTSTQFGGQLFPKVGCYQFSLGSAAEVSDITMYSKGLYIHRAGAGSPAITPDGLLALLRSI